MACIYLSVLNALKENALQNTELIFAQPKNI